MYAGTAPPNTCINCKQHVTTHNSNLDALLDSYMNNKIDSEDKVASNENRKGCNDPAHPWLQGFHEYLNTHKHLSNSTIMQWWGIHSTWYPVWESWAQDFLPIMASSVSSKQIFSSAGITIRKHYNHLKADIVEVLQFLKCATRSNLLVQEDPSIATEMAMQRGVVDSSGEDGGVSDNEWDGDVLDNK